MLPGGGAAYAYMTRYADEFKADLPEGEALAVDILMQAIAAPCKQIADNAGVLGAMVFERVRDQEWGYGYNAAKLEYEDLLAAGVCDPASVTTWALDNAASISASLLNTEAIVAEKEVFDEASLQQIQDVSGGIGAKASDYAW